MTILRGQGRGRTMQDGPPLTGMGRQFEVGDFGNVGAVGNFPENEKRFRVIFTMHYEQL